MICMVRMEKARKTISGPLMFLTNKDNNTVFPISANDPKAMKAARTEKHMAIIAKMVGQTTGAKGGDHKKYVAHLAMIHSDKAKDKTPGEFEEHLLSEVEKHSGKKREELGEAVKADLKGHAEKHAGKQPSPDPAQEPVVVRAGSARTGDFAIPAPTSTSTSTPNPYVAAKEYPTKPGVDWLPPGPFGRPIEPMMLEHSVVADSEHATPMKVGDVVDADIMDPSMPAGTKLPHRVVALRQPRPKGMRRWGQPQDPNPKEWYHTADVRQLTQTEWDAHHAGQPLPPMTGGGTAPEVAPQTAATPTAAGDVAGARKPEPPKAEGLDPEERRKHEAIKMPFGKHAGKTLGELMRKNPDYVEWMAREMKAADLREAAQALTGLKKGIETVDGPSDSDGAGHPALDPLAHIRDAILLGITA